MNEPTNIEKLIYFLSKYIEVTQEEKDFLQNIIQNIIFKKKEIIHQQGKIQKNIGFIVKGSARVFYIDDSGNEDTFEFVFENTTIGEYRNLITQEISPASAQAMEETEVIYITKEDFLEFMKKFPQYYNTPPFLE